jgi:glucitol operon activator protein
MDATATTIIVGLALAWAIQYVLTFWQMRRFYARIAQLRRYGKVSIGVAGSAWKRRQYAVLVVDVNHRIVRAEQLSGWTVLATLKPIAGLNGRPMSDLFDDEVELPVSEKLLLALRNAAGYIKDAQNRKQPASVEENQLSSSVIAN